VEVRIELRHALQVGERWHRTQARRAHVFAAELYGECIGRPEAVALIVATCAGHLSGSRQSRFEKQPAAERRQRLGTRIGLRPGKRFGMGDDGARRQATQNEAGEGDAGAGDTHEVKSARAPCRLCMTAR
jgi:hypothetical protein